MSDNEQGDDRASPGKRVIYTIGHSTRSIDDFIALLRTHEIGAIADVRLLPGSKRYPQFNSDALRDSLDRARVRYEHFRELGGRRKPLPNSHNTAWRNEAFRGYADYMETEVFGHGMARLLALAATMPSAIMCAEAVWWRCHRALISDYLKVRGYEVLHILSPTKAEPHPFTSAAGVIDGDLSYGKL